LVDSKKPPNFALPNRRKYGGRVRKEIEKFFTKNLEVTKS
jgi:hypothetical protein